ncbi:MAG: glycosyl hydrolase family 39 [Terracidiphilus sp.]|nr:glycosyl hydrolase family 39 [Terracidiphilus sp.]
MQPVRLLRCLAVLFALSLFIFPAILAEENIVIDAQAPATPFPHFWEGTFGSGRAILSLRESYRNDLRAVKHVADFNYVRFHAIFHDEIGVYNEDAQGNPVYNFSYVDQIYDGLLANGVRPFVEISLMPRKLAANPDAVHSFWYKPIVSPPKSMERWDDLIRHFARHLVDRYGIDEVAKWYFEVWNEPNLDFWGGDPRQSTYFALYAHTARALKSVNPRLRVGGPSTAQAAWVTDFLNFTAANHVPVDFVSTHAYADDTVRHLFGNNENVPVDDRVCRAVAKVRGEIKTSSSPNLPFFMTEWNVQGTMQTRDTIFVGPALANTVRQCDGLVDSMSFWTFSDVFEEQGPIAKPFIGRFGLRAKGGINKPAFYAFELLHQLGNQRLTNASRNVIVTRTAQGGLVIAAWNLIDPGEQGSDQTMNLNFRNLPADTRVTMQRLDADHGNVLKEYAAMGQPLDPTPAQVDQLNRATALPAPEKTRLDAGSLMLHLTPNTLALIKIGH